MSLTRERAMEIMEPLRQEIQVRFCYAVHFTADIFHSHNPLFRNIVQGDGPDLPKKLLMVIDDNVHRHHPQLLNQIEAYCCQHHAFLRLAGPMVLLPGGERVKNDPQSVRRLHQAIHTAGLCRHSYVVAIGGGAVLDLAGYAAATAHRGIRLIRVPTTVLAQADAAIGVKNGVNAFGKKNFIGTFAPPVAVINDAAFLPTLSQRDWISGIAEAVKVALIKDAAFFAFLEEHAPALAARNLQLMQQVIHRCAALHLEHIATSGDPFEFGSSRPLDFGHWAAHKLEQLAGFTLRHGEAVAIGMALDTTYAGLAGFLPKTDEERILTTLENLGFTLYDPKLEGSLILEGLKEFREHLGGTLTISLLWGIGQSREVHVIDPKFVRSSVNLLRARALSALREARPAIIG